MTKWERSDYKLRPDHTWRASPGYGVFVADRGAVRFEFPSGWTMKPGPDSIRFTDRKPPDDDCLLQVSVQRCPPDLDWTLLPLPELLADIVREDKRGLTVCGDTHYERRLDLELAWVEARFTDPNENREARSRSCFARDSEVQAFITMDFWPEHTARFHPVWAHVLETVRVGQYIEDPTRGPRDT